MTTTPTGFITLSSLESRKLIEKHPELVDESTESFVGAFTAADPTEMAALSDAIIAVRTAFRSGQASTGDILRALLPEPRLTLGPSMLAQTHRSAQLRSDIAERYGLLSAVDVAERSGSRAGNLRALASRWKSSGAIFAVPVDHSFRYPGFQFDESGQPLPAVKGVLGWLGQRLTPWEIAFWFAADNSWLGGVKPVEVLERSGEQVVVAAQKLSDEIAEP